MIRTMLDARKTVNHVNYGLGTCGVVGKMDGIYHIFL